MKINVAEQQSLIGSYKVYNIILEGIDNSMYIPGGAWGQSNIYSSQSCNMYANLIDTVTLGTGSTGIFWNSNNPIVNVECYRYMYMYTR